MELLIKSHPMVQFLEKGFKILKDTFKIRMNYEGLAQHYYNKSTMLDFTSNLEVMKFFATSDYECEEEKYIPVTDENKVGVIYYYELRFPEAFSNHEHYALKTIGKQVFSRSGRQSGFLLEMDKNADLKTNVLEIKKVYFHHNAKISNEIFAASHNGKDYFPMDILQHAWNDRFRQRNKDNVVSKKAVKLNVSRNPGETEDSIIQKLKDRGISVDDFNPIFDEEELKEFYQNIDEWRSDFCSDIHFADTEDELYRQLMIEQINDPNNVWAFWYKA